MPANVHDIAAALVRCPSVTPEEGGALDTLGALLAGAGFRVERVTFSEPGTPDVDNLYARIGTGGPHLMFAGHTDVVPPGDPAAWTSPPFEPTVRDGVLYGRGTTDMKGGIAAFVAATLDFLAETGPPNGSISFLITGDEEGPSVNGTVKLLDWVIDKGERFDHAIVGEPTSVETVGDTLKIGRRGSFSAVLRIAGKQGHVAYPHLADNPIRGLVTLAAALQAPLDQGNDYFPPSNLEIVDVAAGNAAFNVIPGQVEAKLNVRFNSLWTLDTLEAELRRRLHAAAGNVIRWELVPQRGNSNSFLTEPGGFVAMVRGAVEGITGRAAAFSTSGGTSDARFITRYGPVIELGLVGKTMHQVNESVPLTDLTALTQVYRAVLDAYFAPRTGGAGC